MVERSGNFINKKVAALAVAGSMLIGGSGCAEARIVDTSNNIPTSVEDTIKTSETTKLVTPEITVTPTTTPTPVETTAAPTETDVNAELVAAPEISGLSKEIQDGKVVYKAVEGNEYGVEAGKFAGEYNPNVSVEGEQVGAVAFIPAVAEKILNNQLAEFPEGEQEFKVLLPVDTTQTGENGVNIIQLNKDTGNEMVQISCDSDLDVLNIIPDSDMFYIYWWSDSENGKYCSIMYMGPNSEKGTERNALYNVQIIVPETDSIDNTTTALNIKFASNIGSTDGKIVWIGNGGTEGPYPVKVSDMVTIDGKLVGITSEK